MRHDKVFHVDGVHGWRTPEMALTLMAISMALALYVWTALLNNFAVEEVGFDGALIGGLHSVREIPGFLSFTAIFFIVLIREQNFALLTLAILAGGVLVTGVFPSPAGLFITTIIMSFGFHYYETMAQSLSLQWLKKDQAAEILGRIMSATSFAQIVAYGLIFIAWKTLEVSFLIVFAAAGCLSLVICIFVWLAFPKFETGVVQRKKIILRKRYWLYYALTFMGGARRQIFMVFASFMMVEKFGFAVVDIAILFLINGGVMMIFAPIAGRFIDRFGERRILKIEYIGLAAVFAAYAFVDIWWLAALLYLIDHAFYAFAIAIKTYFQKIADPADIAPTAGVAFTINHIAAVIIPFAFGLLWLVSPAAVFLAGSAMAGVSLALAFLIPRHPEPGHELVWQSKLKLAPAEQG